MLTHLGKSPSQVMRGNLHLSPQRAGPVTVVTVVSNLGENNSAGQQHQDGPEKFAQGRVCKITHFILIWKTFPPIALLNSTSFSQISSFQ